LDPCTVLALVEAMRRAAAATVGDHGAHLVANRGLPLILHMSVVIICLRKNGSWSNYGQLGAIALGTIAIQIQRNKAPGGHPGAAGSSPRGGVGGEG
jgi:hypothetical protein